MRKYEYLCDECNKKIGYSKIEFTIANRGDDRDSIRDFCSKECLFKFIDKLKSNKVTMFIKDDF